MSTQPAFTWSLTGIGTIDSTGMYTAPTSTGSATVQATAAALSGTASVTVSTLPAVPTNLTATAISKHQVNLSWLESSTNQTGFTIQRSTDGTNWTQIANVGSTVRTYQDNTVSRRKTYYYRVDAYNSVGNSAWSNVANVVTPGVGIVSGGTGGASGQTGPSSQVDDGSATLRERAAAIQSRFAAAGLHTLDSSDSLPGPISTGTVGSSPAKAASRSDNHEAATPATRLQILVSRVQANAQAFAEHQSGDLLNVLETKAEEEIIQKLLG